MTDTEQRPILTQRQPQTTYGAVSSENDLDATESDNLAASIISDSDTHIRSTFTFFEKLGYGLGHVYNDLCAGVWFSYTLLFMQGAIGMSSAVAGTLVMVGQVADALATPIVGCLADKYGTKRQWHIGGTCLVFISFPLIFSLCPWCLSSPFWWQPSYFSFIIIMFQMGWAIVQISHLAMIPEISRTQRDRADLTTIRYSVSVISSVLVYMVMWGVLTSGSSTQSHIVPDDASKFRDVALILTLVGISMSVVFHLSLSYTGYGIRRQLALDTSNRPILQPNGSASTIEGNDSKLFNGPTQNPRKNFLRSPYLYQNALLYVFSRLFCTTALVYIPLWLDERTWMPSKSTAFFPTYIIDWKSKWRADTNTEDDNQNVAHIAIIPLISFLASFVASVAMKFSHHLFGPKIAYLLGTIISCCACIWVAVGAPSSASALDLYMIAMLFGAGSSITMISSLCITADMIGRHAEQSGFIYSAVTFADKLITGVAVVVIETLKCGERKECPEYYKNILAYACGTAACLGLFVLATLQCNRR